MARLRPTRADRAGRRHPPGGDSPIVAFGAVEGYGPIFNAGAVFHDGRFHLFARGVRDAYRRNAGSGARFLDYVSDILVFTSEDGVRYEFQQVLAEARPTGIYAYEDPRVQLVARPTAPSISSCPTRTCRRPRRNEFWRIGVHLLGYADGRFSLNESSGPRDRAGRRAGQGRDRSSTCATAASR